MWVRRLSTLSFTKASDYAQNPLSILGPGYAIKVREPFYERVIAECHLANQIPLPSQHDARAAQMVQNELRQKVIKGQSRMIIYKNARI